MFASAGYLYFPLKAFDSFEDIVEFAIDHELLLEVWFDNERGHPWHVKPTRVGRGIFLGNPVWSVSIVKKSLGPETMMVFSKIYAMRACRPSGVVEVENDDRSYRPPV